MNGNISMHKKTPAWRKGKIIIILVYFVWNIVRKYASFMRVYYIREIVFMYNPKQVKYENSTIKRWFLTFMKSVLAKIKFSMTGGLLSLQHLMKHVKCLNNVCNLKGQILLEEDTGFFWYKKIERFFQWI